MTEISQAKSDQAERAALKAALTAVIDEACEIHENPHPLIGFRDYLLHRLGTYGYAHGEYTLRQAIEQHDGLVAENERLREALVVIVTAPDDFNGAALRMIADEALETPPASDEEKAT